MSYLQENQFNLVKGLQQFSRLYKVGECFDQGTNACMLVTLQNDKQPGIMPVDDPIAKYQFNLVELLQV